MVYIGDSFYVIGGEIDDNEIIGRRVIGRLDAIRRVWSKSGELISKRSGHNAIYDGSSLIVGGGYGLYKTERCVISNGQATCTDQNPELDYYSFYPELFLVKDNFCKTLS